LVNGAASYGRGRGGGGRAALGSRSTGIGARRGCSAGCRRAARLRRSGLRVAARGQQLLIGDARTGVMWRGSAGSGEDGRAARAGARTYGGRAFRGAGRRAADSVAPRRACCLGKEPHLGKARGRLGCRGGRRWRAAGACGSALSAAIHSECPCLTAIFSRNLNRSAQCGQQKSCRSHYPLQLLQRPSSVFLTRFCRNALPTLNAALFQETGGTVG
jgi:hypothetical protein